jgi:hypothetical protein
MSMGRSSMGKQIAVTRSSRDGVKKMGGGGLAMISPAASLVESLRSGQPEGILGALSPVAMAMKAAKKKRGEDEGSETKTTVAMKSGGKVGRGDGCCMKGKTKGRAI